MIRDAFVLPEGQIYLLGHSLGPAPKAALAAVERAASVEWAQGLAASWNDAHWFTAPERVGGKIGSLIGAPPGSVIVADSVSVNVFKLAAAALRAAPTDRRVILIEDETFPTDGYVIEGLARLASDVQIARAPRDRLFTDISAQTALILASQIDFRTGAAFDIEAQTASARCAGARVLWDLSHSIGAVALDLSAMGVELAIGCGYKYLNGGPGAPAFAFVAPHLIDALENPISGWFGHAAPFAFEPQYRPAPDARRFAAGTPPILSLTALEAAVDLALTVPPQRAAAHVATLQAAFLDALAGALPCLSPAARGGHLAFAHPEALALKTALIAAGLIGDFRPPDTIRFGFSPLFLNEPDVVRAAGIVREVLAAEAWRGAAHSGVVT
ncbi:MAG: aminotransferase class V-fold PLP-dependent enzyme [Caulobacterales bacterium]